MSDSKETKELSDSIKKLLKFMKVYVFEDGKIKEVSEKDITNHKKSQKSKNKNAK